MTSVIRSSRFNDQPLLLVRARKMDAPDEPIDSLDAAMGEHLEQNIHVPMPEFSVSSETEPAASSADTAPTISYEEYEQRFAEELERLRVQARDEGHAEGKAEGQREGEKEFAERLRQVDELFISARDAIERNLDGMSDTAVEIVFEAITRILGDRFVDKSGVEETVREVIRQSKERSKLVVRLSAADVEALSERRNELVDGLNVGHVELVADDLVELGGCILETPSGSLDGRLEIQLQRLRETLLNARQRAHEHGD
jgi:flagellar assembly protein FliH